MRRPIKFITIFLCCLAATGCSIHTKRTNDKELYTVNTEDILHKSEKPIFAGKLSSDGSTHIFRITGIKELILATRDLCQGNAGTYKFFKIIPTNDKELTFKQLCSVRSFNGKPTDYQNNFHYAGNEKLFYNPYNSLINFENNRCFLEPLKFDLYWEPLFSIYDVKETTPLFRKNLDSNLYDVNGNLVAKNSLYNLDYKTFDLTQIEREFMFVDPMSKEMNTLDQSTSPLRREIYHDMDNDGTLELIVYQTSRQGGCCDKKYATNLFVYKTDIQADKDHNPYIIKGDYLFNERDYAKALKVYALGLRDNPNNVALNMKAGLAAFKTNDNTKLNLAKIYLAKADPAHPIVINTLNDINTKFKKLNNKKRQEELARIKKKNFSREKNITPKEETIVTNETQQSLVQNEQANLLQQLNDMAKLFMTGLATEDSGAAEGVNESGSSK